MSGPALALDAKQARVGIAILLGLNAAFLAIMALPHAAYSLRPGGPAAWLGGGAAFYAVGCVLTTTALAGAWKLGRGERCGRWGLVCLAASSALWELANAASGNLLVENVAPGACLFGWLVGLAYGRALGLGEPAEGLAVRGAASAFGIGYVTAVVSKLRIAGLAWTSPALVWSTVYAHRSVDRHGLSREAADWLLSSPLVARSGAVATLLFESMAVLLLGPPRWRMVGAAAVIATHLGFLLFHGSTSPLPPVAALVFLLEARHAHSEPGGEHAAVDPDVASRVLRRSAFIAAVVVGVAVGAGRLLGR
jgi:hypothetical protein